jgi:DNA-binding IclR family transcriptional regulator
MNVARATGTQTVTRAVGLLKVLASGPRQGWRLSDLAATCSLDRATTHRILKALAAERLVVRDRARRYAPGPLLFELGLSYSRPVDLIQATRRPLRAIASEFSAVGSLWLRSGADVVCADRVGATRTKVFVDVGTRRPLASMAPGISILLELPVAERRALIAENLRRIERLFPGRLAEFRNMIARSERAGYGITFGDVGKGIYSVGAPILTPHGSPVAALCLIGPTREFPGNRIERLAAQLRSTATQIVDAQQVLLEAWQIEVSDSEI